MECESYMLNCTHGMPRGVHMPQVAQCGHSLYVSMLHLTSLPSFSPACSGVSSLVGTPSASAALSNCRATTPQANGLSQGRNRFAAQCVVFGLGTMRLIVSPQLEDREAAWAPRWR